MFKLLKTTCDLKQLEAIAKRIVDIIVPGDLLLLKGELGAGKTTFARFFIQSIYKKNFLTIPGPIKSPSFPIMISYPLNNLEILHYDLYRLTNKNELKELNIDENIIKNITLIEWPDMIIRNLLIENGEILDF